MTYPSDPNQPTYPDDYPPHTYPSALPAPTPRRKRPRWLHIVGYLATAGVFLGIGLGAGGTGTPTNTAAAPAPTVTVTVAPEFPVLSAAPTPAAVKPTPTPKPKPVKASIADGEQVTVGADVPAGRYSARSTDNTCYWEIDKSGSNGQDIVANDLGKTGHITVTLKKGEDFSSARCGDWTQQ